jgi:hypothetical protein
MSNAPDATVEAAQKALRQRPPCEQDERVGARSSEPRFRGVTSEQDKFVTEWYCYPDDESGGNSLRPPDRRSE